jgi:hypothetical protein
VTWSRAGLPLKLALIAGLPQLIELYDLFSMRGLFRHDEHTS